MVYFLSVHPEENMEWLNVGGKYGFHWQDKN